MRVRAVRVSSLPSRAPQDGIGAGVQLKCTRKSTEVVRHFRRGPGSGNRSPRPVASPNTANLLLFISWEMSVKGRSVWDLVVRTFDFCCLQNA